MIDIEISINKVVPGGTALFFLKSIKLVSRIRKIY